MSLLQRRILTITLLLIFALAGPAVILYGEGYRLNFRSWRIDRVGLLHVTTDPDNSQAILNGTTYNVGKELVLKSLQPGPYDLVLAKDGYYSWVKSIDIYPGQSTILREIHLFRKADPQQIGQFQNAVILGHETGVFVLQQGQEIIVQQTNAKDLPQTIFPLLTEDPVTQYQLDDQNNRIFFKQKGIWFIGSADQQPVSLDPVLPKDTTDIKLTLGQVLAVTNNALWSLAVNNEGVWTSEKILSQNLVQTVRAHDKGYWIISTEPSQQRSFLYNLDGPGSRLQLITNLPYSDTYRITDDFNGFLTVRDETHKRLLLIDTNSATPQVQRLSDIISWEWSKDQKQLLTATDFEVRVWHVDNGLSQELILRLSTPLTGVAWYPDESHVFYTTRDSLNLAERYSQQQRNIFTLAQTIPAMHVEYTDPKGTFTLFSSQNENELTFYQLAL